MTIYNYSGYPGTTIAVNDSHSGATVAIIKEDGAIHEDYTENPLTLQWIADCPDWDAVIADLPVPDPEEAPPNWTAFRETIALLPAYQAWWNAVFLINPLVATNLNLAVIQENIPIAQALLSQGLAIAQFDTDGAAEVQALIDVNNIPLSLN